MPKAARVKIYAVRVGRRPGIYDTWNEAETQTKGFPGAVHKAFSTYGEAQLFLRALTVEIPKVCKDERSNRSPLPDGGSTAIGGASTKLSRDLEQGTDEAESNDRSLSSNTQDPALSKQQSDILNRILNGENFFFTGAAGTGKSVLLRAIIRSGGEKPKESKKISSVQVSSEEPWVIPERRRLAVTASTGMAAINIGGCTLHSWAGVGLGHKDAVELVEMVKRSKMSKNRWRTTEVLIVDEVSMIDAEFLDKLDYIGKVIRGDDRPFGGIQMIMCGDFFQLPPVSEENASGTKYAFDAQCWEKTFGDNVATLTCVYRQADQQFVQLLENMRKGKVSDQQVRLLVSLNRPLQFDDGVEPVGLYPKRAQVSGINARRLNALPGPVQQFRARDHAGRNSNGFQLTENEATRRLNTNTRWPEILDLKIGALVMLVFNWRDFPGLVNGSTGKVVDLLTLDAARQAGVSIPHFVDQALLEDRQYPVVEFAQPRFATSPIPRRIFVPALEQILENANGTSEASRIQVPLILAWALTIHKAQGQSLDRVRIDLSGTFDCGQAYVAISRATDLDGLELKGFKRGCVMASQRVLEWSRVMDDENDYDELLKNSVFDY